MRKGCFVCAAAFVLVAAGVMFFGRTAVEKISTLIYPIKYSEIVEAEAEKFELDQYLVYAIIKTESNFDEDALSHANAHGLMQLTEETFLWISAQYPPEESGGDIFDPRTNIHCGCALLRLLLNEYGSLDVALAAYNAGMGNVSSWLDDERYSNDGSTLESIPFHETSEYVKRVNRNYEIYRNLYEKEGN